MIILACTASALILAGCAAYSAAALHGHHPGPGRLECLRRHTAIHALIITTLALIAAVRIARAVLHPARYAGYLAARIFRRIPGQPDDGDPLDPDEARDFIAICRGWKHPAPERTRQQ